MVETGTLSTTVDEMYAAWNTRDRKVWRSDPRRYQELGESALSLGHPSLAHDAFSEALEVRVNDLRLRYLQALALARSGSTKSAAEVTDQLLHQLGSSSSEYWDTVSLAGRIAKDRYAKESNDGRRLAAASASADYYERAFRHSGDYFPGINAATMYVLRDDEENGRAVARSILDVWMDQANGTTSYWLAATIGEAHLILGKGAAAEEWYARARELAGKRLGDVASMRRQIKLLAAARDDAERLMKVLAVPKVVAFAGHTIDAPDREEPRFPPAAAEAAFARIKETLDELSAGIGYTSAACGGDILFIEAMLERNAEVHVILPFDKDDFMRTSVSFAGSDWERRFENALAEVSTVSYATDEKYLGDDTLFGYAAELVQGMAILRADQLVDAPVLVALADSQS